MKLNAWNMSNGEVEIHAVGCSHKPGSGRSKSQFQDQVEFGQIDYPTKFDFAHDYWDNGILEESEAENGVGSFDVFAEMDFKPCTKSLPTGGSDVPAAKRTKLEIRREGRRHLLIAMIAERDNVLTYDHEVAQLMTEQIDRCRTMFGLQDELK